MTDKIIEHSVAAAFILNEEWSNESYAFDVCCPECGFDYSVITNMREIDGEDNRKASWEGRGNLHVVHFEGECGHEWEICFGFHKGKTTAFSRMFG